MLDASDLETRARTYLNEATADFYTQAEVWRWLSLAQKEIAQKALCVRRILDASQSATRSFTSSAYKVMHVEYVPSSGRRRMLRKIDPLKLGRMPGAAAGATGEPRFWTELGDTIIIDPEPAGVYSLVFYVADLPKMQHSTFPITAWNSGWTGSGTGTWTNGAASAVYAGTTGQSGINTWGTAITNGGNYTFQITISAISNCRLYIKGGSTASPGQGITAAGVHTVNLLSNGTALTLTATMTGATGGLTVDDLYILKEVDFAATGDQTELPPAWQHLLALYATHSGLIKDRRYGPAQMLAAMHAQEMDYLRQTIVEVIPDGRLDLTEQ